MLVADTDETLSYVFESNKLPEIRGASLQLDLLNKKIGNMVRDLGPDSHVIYAGGGSLLAEVSMAEAATLATSIEAIYPAETGAATITAAWRPLPPTEKAHYGEVVAWAGHWLRRRKEEKGALPFFETLAHQKRCPSCQKRPASNRQPIPWCEVCHAKRQAQRRFTWFNIFTTFVDKETDLQKKYYGQHITEADYPQDLTELATASQGRRGYVAFLYFDGDNIGSLLQAARTRQDYETLSRQLRQTTEKAVFTSLATHLHPTIVKGSASRAEVGQPQLEGQDILIHPFEIITIGGDDVMLIVPAHVALPIAIQMGELFSEELTTAVAKLGIKRDKPETMSGGIVIAESHTPIRILRDLSHQLQDEAKKLVDGGLDFHILKSSDMPASKIETLRESFPYLLEKREKGKDLRLLARPYTYPRARTLWQGLLALEKDRFPTSQMHLLAESLLDGRASATLFYEYQKQRHQSRAARESGPYATMQQLLTDLPSNPSDGRPDASNPLPWYRARPDDSFLYTTSLWDIAELYDFVPGTILPDRKGNNDG
ncbi:MAG: type III-B CRISPR-associated protein Cas10/Cmr2 [Ardenticatenaceae bacterium]|nr:type III-B CRISPR-associated protein Cas10/Cmr2 [Ardenticatenaceae bacterium]